MKKLLKLFICSVVCLSLFACKDITKKVEGEVAYLVYYQDETGESYHDAVSRALITYMENYQHSFTEYQMTDTTTATFVKTVDLATKKGSQIFVVPYSFFQPLIEVHENYPDVEFILLDAPIADEYLQNVNNIISISFNTYEMGYLAGSMIPLENYRKVGFLQSIHSKVEDEYLRGIKDGLNASAKALEEQANLKDKKTKTEIKMDFTVYDLKDLNEEKRKAIIAEAYQKEVDVFLYMDSSLFDLLDEYTYKSGYRFVGYCANQKNGENVLFYVKIDYTSLMETLLERYMNHEEIENNLIFGVKDGVQSITYMENAIHKATERLYLTSKSKIEDGTFELLSSNESNALTHVSVVNK